MSLISLRNNQACLNWQVLPNAQLVWQHWGHPIPASAIDAPAALTSRLALTPSLGVVQAQGLGWMYQPSIRGHRSDGTNWVQQFVLQHTVSEANRCIFTLMDELAQLSLKITYQLNAFGVVEIQSELTNCGTTDFHLHWLAAGCLPLPAHVKRFKTWKGAWAGEFEPVEQVLNHGMWSKTNVRGRTSHDTQPSMLVYSQRTDEAQGEVFAAHLGHSGNYHILLEPLDDGKAQLQMGEFFMPGEMCLPAQGIYTSPQLYAGYSGQGFNGAMQAFHATVRSTMNAPTRPRPVHFNTWEAVYFNHEPRLMSQLIQNAAALGVERFVLDDGWFFNRTDDKAGLGDWWADPVRYPQGLQPLFDEVVAAGMECGLWFEPEMVNENSQLYRTHPDWVMALPQRNNPVGRNQRVLNITLPEVQDYLYDTISRLLIQHPIRYVKWDMNRDIAPAADHVGRAHFYAYIRALYRLLERLSRAFTHVEFESCASGGARIDYGILPFVRRFWVSDCNDAMSRLRINQGFLQFFPPEYMGTHIGPAPAHTTQRSHDLHLRGTVALLGHMGLELDILNLTESDTVAVKHWIALYKKYRHITHQGQVSQGATAQHEWHLSVAQQQAILAVFKVTRMVGEHDTPIILHLPTGQWQVQVLNVLGTPQIYSAEQLAYSGLRLPQMLPEAALLFELTRLA
ncbi:MAG: alpha-galactosidase [Formosimonas sp.]